jgi:hypothetical protein
LQAKVRHAGATLEIKNDISHNTAKDIQPIFCVIYLTSVMGGMPRGELIQPV